MAGMKYGGGSGMGRLEKAAKISKGKKASKKSPAKKATSKKRPMKKTGNPGRY